MSVVYGYLRAMRGIIHPSSDGAETSLPSAEAENARLFDRLTDDQKDLLEKIAEEMSSKLGVAPEDQRLVALTRPEGQTVYVVDASPNGQHIGRYSQILQRRQEDPAWFTIQVADQVVDPLADTTEEVYRAMVEDARMRGETVMPDSIELSHQSELPWTATFLTGEPLTQEGEVLIASFSSDKVDVVGFNVNRGGVSMRVRPCINIGVLEGAV